MERARERTAAPARPSLPQIPQLPEAVGFDRQAIHQRSGTGTSIARVPIALRRQRVAGALAAVTVLVALGALSSEATALWAVVAVLGLLTVGYSLAAVSFNRRAARRELVSAFGAPPAALGSDWAQFDPRLRLEDHGGLSAVPAPQDDVTAVAVVRFMVAYVSALALTPFVFALRLVAGDLTDLERRNLVGRLVRFQAYWRGQSLRMVTASVAATATVAIGGATGSAAFAGPAASTGASYTVQSGDTLGAIAAANGTTVAALVAANQLADPNTLMVGQVLDLSGGSASSGAATTSAVSGGSSYTVQVGDTLGAIAAANGTTVAALAAANGLSNPNLIMVGQVLTLGGGGATGSLVSTTSPAPTTSPTPTTASGSSSSGEYTVQAGDTLASIAAVENTSWGALAAANNLSNPNLIYVGEVLTVSGGNAASSGAAPTSNTATSIVATYTETSATTPDPPVPPMASSAPAASGATLAVQTALAQVGVPYVYGGASPSGFDCSGLVMYAWAAAGVSLPHYSVSQYSGTTRISEDELEPGDIVFYDNSEGAQPGHEALYIGNGQVVAANTTGTLVQTQSITYDGTPMGFGRVA